MEPQAQHDDDGGARQAPELAYYADISRPLLRMVRSIGVLSIIIGVSNLVGVVMAVATRGSRPQNSPGTSFYVLNEILGYFMAAILAVLLLVAGGGCLLLRPRGRRPLLVWAWAMVVWAVYAVCVNSWYTIQGPSLSVAMITWTLAYNLTYWTAMLALPFVVIFVMRHEAVRRLFDAPGDVSAPSV